MSGAVGVGVIRNLHSIYNYKYNNNNVLSSSSSPRKTMLSSSSSSYYYYYYYLSNNNNNKNNTWSFFNPRNTRQQHRSRSLSVGSGVVVETTTEAQSSSSEPCRRRLILLRHAHSSYPKPHYNSTSSYSLRDHDRPLSKSGQADAIRVSNKLQQLGWIPQLILSSDAARTKETLAIMQEQVREFLDAEVHYISSFYSIAAMDGQTAQHLQHAICKLSSDEMSTVMCMGHNRGWEEAASMFSGKLIELKTCNAALLEATGETWKEAFFLAGFGGWKLQAIVTPNSSLESL